MKRTILLTAAILCAAGTRAQEAYDLLIPEPETPVALRPVEGGRIYRTEVIPYDKRHDADARNLAGADAYMAYTPEPFAASGDAVAVGQVVEIPYVWTDGVVYLHLENIGTAYTLTVNDSKVAEVEDPSTPAEFALTPYIREGKNAIALTLRRSAADRINAVPASRKAFENCYLYTQTKRSIRDFEIALVPDSTRKFGVLELAIVAQNGFNYDEPVTVGYDIYSPQGKLLEFNMQEVTIPGRSTDTVRFTPFIYGTNANKWEPGAKNPPLYKVMLFTRRDGAYREYMPLKIGFGKTELVDGRLTRFDKELKLVKAGYNAAADRKTTLAELKTLKAKGNNTICPDYPQPGWFYDLCDELGLYVIDCANINAPEKRDDRKVGGTPSNDPSLADEYLERVKAMYYRSRNHSCVIAFALGGESGNGYNMYKAYEWLKSVEKSRPVICADADGEWNSDLWAMTVELIVIGKTDSKEIAALVEMYARRVNFYCKFAVTALPDVRNTRNLTVKQQRTAEGEAILRQTTDGDYVVLLDERGEEMRSVEFAYWLQKRMNSGVKRLVLVIGGPYGFSDEVYRRADAKLSLSRMTFSHQIVRAIFAEQIYRAFTILNNEPYHHE